MPGGVIQGYNTHGRVGPLSSVDHSRTNLKSHPDSKTNELCDTGLII